MNIMHDKYYHFSTYIALVLDLPVPVEVVDGVGTDGGDPGDGRGGCVGGSNHNSSRLGRTRFCQSGPMGDGPRR